MTTVMDQKIAIFIDFENIRRALEDHYPGQKVELKKIFDSVVRVSNARPLVKRAYADWGALRDYRSDLLDNATETVQTFELTPKGKNGADMRIAIDAMEFVLRRNDITHVAVVSGDSDLVPLVVKLREMGVQIVGMGVRPNTSTFLARSCDRFLYYDELRESDLIPDRPLGPVDPARLLVMAMNQLGNRPVPGSALKVKMRQIDPTFDETRSGHLSFLDFIQANAHIVEYHKPPVGDITITLRSGVEGAGGYAPAPLSTADRYRLWLRDNNFRFVPSAERLEIIREIYEIFNEDDEPLSLKEAKEDLHAWFEEHKPDVSWESINSTVYHLFYTWCFRFDRSDENDGRQLWEKRTWLQDGIDSGDALIERAEQGIVRRLWERERDDLDAEALASWLYDGNPEGPARVKALIEQVSAPDFQIIGRGGG